MRFESWTKKMKEELESIGLTYIWHNQQEWDTSRLRRIIRERCNDIERQNLSLIRININGQELHSRGN
jgi:hypothetical protein